MHFTKRRRKPAGLILIVALMATSLAVKGGCAGGDEVTEQSLRKARVRWAKAGIHDYDLEWTSSGAMNSRYAVAVRGGRVESVKAVAPDGRTHLLKPSEPRYYSIDGLFLTIANELAQLDQPEPFSRPKGTKAVLQFTADPEYGYPRHYRRDVLGAPAALAIDVVRFAPTSPRPAPRAD